eukprot:366031-Chlamydomonas_euryale.AAC.9
MATYAITSGRNTIHSRCCGCCAAAAVAAGVAVTAGAAGTTSRSSRWVAGTAMAAAEAMAPTPLPLASKV